MLDIDIVDLASSTDACGRIRSAICTDVEKRDGEQLRGEREWRAATKYPIEVVESAPLHNSNFNFNPR